MEGENKKLDTSRSKNEGLSRDAIVNGDGVESNSLKSLQPGSNKGSAWMKVSQGNSTAAKSQRLSKPQAIHHFGLLDVPQPEALFSTPHTPGSWRGGAHASIPIPEASELISPLETNAMSHSQPIRPKAVSRKAGEVTSRREQSQHHKPMIPRPKVGATNMEGSATSDDHENSHSRLIPKRGQGPGLRSEGGGKIDEYLMRLLNTGGPPPESSKKSDGTGQRHVSRLGPLAGAGVMASSMQRVGSGPTKLRTQDFKGERRKQEVTDNLTEPATDPTTRPSHTQPSIGGENREEALQGSQSIHPTKRKLSTELTNNYLASMRPPNTYTSGRNVRREGEAGNHGSVRRRLGPEKWTEMRSILGQQRQQFQQQVNEMHRLRDVQARLEASSSATRPLQPSNQDLSGSSRPSWLNGASSLGWMPMMERFGSNGEAFSWPAFQTAQAKASAQDSIKQKSEPVKSLSQTTRLALDAQRMRQKIRARDSGKAPSIGQQVPSGQETTRNSERSNHLRNGLNTSMSHMQARQAQDMQNLWFSFMQQQNQAMQGNKNASRAHDHGRLLSGTFYTKLEPHESGLQATCIDFPGISALGRSESTTLEAFKQAVKSRILEDKNYKLPHAPSSHSLALAKLENERPEFASRNVPRAELRVVRFE